MLSRAKMQMLGLPVD